MVSIADGEAKSLKTVMQELNAHRKHLHRTFFRRSDSDHYTVLMFAHDERSRLVVVYGMVAMPAIHETMDAERFFQEFEVLETKSAPPKRREL